MTRNHSLDALRGVAILLVIGFHLAVPGVFRVGSVGVDLFFVLSGFLISGLLFRDYETLGQIRLGRFWFRRAFKILPPLYTFLAVMAAVTLAAHIFPGRAFISAALFYTNYCKRDFGAGALLWHTWSLAVEEHFYLLSPLLFYALVRTRRENVFRPLPLIAACLYLACFVLRIIDRDPQNALTHLRVDSLFAGVTLRYIERFRSAWFQKLSHPIVLVLGLTFWLPECVYDSGSPLLRSVILTWTSVSAATLIGWCYNHDAEHWWRSNALKTLSSIGLYSYSIYLWQQPIALFFRDIQPAIFFKTCGLVFSVMVGFVMAKLVELPVLRLRERIGSSTPRSATVVSFDQVSV